MHETIDHTRNTDQQTGGQSMRINNVEMNCTVQGDSESWTATAYVPREIAKGNMRSIWEQFVIPCGCGGPGQAFASRPWAYSVYDNHGERIGFVFEQSGGLDI